MVVAAFDAKKKNRAFAVVCRVPVTRCGPRPEDLEHIDGFPALGPAENGFHTDAAPQDPPGLRFADILGELKHEEGDDSNC